MSKFICSDCHRLISKRNKKRHKDRCGERAKAVEGSIHNGRNNPRFRLKKMFDRETGLRL